MKTIKLLVGVVGLILFGSCNKNFLERYPLDQISSQVFWNSESDVNMAVTGCYARMKGSFLDFNRGYLDGLTDGGFVHWGLFNIDDVARGNIHAATGGVISHVYNGTYRGISQCNFFLDNVDKAAGVMAADRLNAAKGEVRFLRALFYFDLVNFFGDVILYKSTPESVAASLVDKSPKAEVLSFIHEDLDFAIANLPDELYAGHAVKGSAMALKVRALLTEEKWADAASLANEIITSGKFSLYPDYPNMFINAGQQNNPEIMFACEYLTPDQIHSVYGMNIEYAAHIFLTNTLENAFECKDGLPIEESPLYDAQDRFSNRDPRHGYIVRNPVGTNWPGHYDYEFANVTGVKNRKYIDPEIEGNYAYAYLNDWNFILIRYADVLLMYAEAKNELSGPDQSVYDAINQVRSRPGVQMPNVDQNRYDTQDEVRDYIRKERFVEFPVEGIRYFDLKRWKIAHEIMPQLTNPAGNQYVFDQKHYYWPFQQFELDANPNLTQTTGY